MSHLDDVKVEKRQGVMKLQLRSRMRVSLPSRLTRSEVHGRFSETTVLGLIVRLAFVPRTHVSFSITHGGTSLPDIRGTNKIAC